VSSPATTLILVRHSNPEADPVVPPSDWALSAAGRARARALADRLRPLSPDAIYNSPERKAGETAGILAAALGLRAMTVPDLREHDRTGVPYFHSPGQFEEQVRRLFASPQDRVFGNESAADCLHRFRRGIGVVHGSRARRPVVVTHGTVMSLYIADEVGVDAGGLWRQLTMPCFAVLGHPAREPFTGIQHVEP
jgi:broad specificity phosphatase PhoE